MRKQLMKQLTLAEIAAAFEDKPSSIGERLAILGIDKKTASGLFSKELLATSVYGASFLKFFQENSAKLGFDDDKIPPEKLPDDFVNPYDDAPKTVDQRLSEVGLADEDKSTMFDPDTLNLTVSGDEFTDFLVKNQKKLLGKLEQLAVSEKGQNAGT